jgi:hypothetical protein
MTDAIGQCAPGSTVTADDRVNDPLAETSSSSGVVGDDERRRAPPSATERVVSRWCTKCHHNITGLMTEQNKQAKTCDDCRGRCYISNGYTGLRLGSKWLLESNKRKEYIEFNRAIIRQAQENISRYPEAVEVVAEAPAAPALAA